MHLQVWRNARSMILAAALLSASGARGGTDASSVWVWDAFGVGSLPVTVEIPSITASPGERATFSVVVHTGDNIVAGIQNDTAFDANVVVAATADGKPDCSVDPDINKPATVFAFQPIGCTRGIDCLGIRAIVVSFSDTDPIADGAVLYTCAVDVAPDAAPGTYTLTLSTLIASTPHGQRLETVGSGGEIVVTEPVAEHALSLEGAADGDAGCAISPAPRHAPGSLVLLAGAILWWRCRRVRNADRQRRS